METPLNILRDVGIWLTTDQVAALCKRSVRWVQNNKNRFDYKRKEKKIIKIELTSAITVREQLEGNKFG